MNIIYKSSDIKQEQLLSVLKLWNDEVGLVYPITEKGFNQNIVSYSNKKVMLAYDEDKLVGFIILKQFSDEFLPSYEEDVFISLFFVHKKYRKQGIGSKLLDFAKENSEGKNLVIGKEIYNFFPGVPTDFDNLTDVWLQKRGFEGVRYTHDLIARNPKSFEIKNQNIKFKYCLNDDKNRLISFLRKNNWNRWAFEAKDYFNKKTIKDENAYLIGENEKDEIVCFCRINWKDMDIVAYNVTWQDRFTNLGGIGPLGVDKEYRKTGLGGDIISKAIECLKEKNVSEIMIDWTGLMELYRKYNFEVWKSYKYMTKEK